MKTYVNPLWWLCQRLCWMKRRARLILTAGSDYSLSPDVALCRSGRFEHIAQISGNRTRCCGGVVSLICRLHSAHRGDCNRRLMLLLAFAKPFVCQKSRTGSPVYGSDSVTKSPHSITNDDNMSGEFRRLAPATIHEPNISVSEKSCPS